MDLTTAKRLTRGSRAYGWVRSTWAEGWRQCPKCKCQIVGTGHGWGDLYARSVNAAIDTAMIEHLTKEH